ncbi:hypothetical protein BDE02_06G033500 [Populus trichocarpa]|nr:hypothetical protein BDE02_06G033500 [Populus trichocarpa]
MSKSKSTRTPRLKPKKQSTTASRSAAKQPVIYCADPFQRYRVLGFNCKICQYCFSLFFRLMNSRKKLAENPTFHANGPLKSTNNHKEHTVYSLHTIKKKRNRLSA